MNCPRCGKHISGLNCECGLCLMRKVSLIGSDAQVQSKNWEDYIIGELRKSSEDREMLEESQEVLYSVGVSPLSVDDKDVKENASDYLKREDDCNEGRESLLESKSEIKKNKVILGDIKSDLINHIGDGAIEKGMKYYDGVGVEQNYFEALKAFELGALLGHAEAQYMCGKTLEKCSPFGDKVGAHRKALEWYRKAANNGLLKAENAINELMPKLEILMKEQKEEREKESLRFERSMRQIHGVCQYCGEPFKLFPRVCKGCGKKKDY